MIGSSRIGVPFLKASFTAKIAAILNASSLESTVVVAAKDNVDFTIDHRITTQDTSQQCLNNALLDCGDIILGNRAADDFVLNGMSLATFGRADVRLRRGRIDHDRRTA